MTRMTSGLTVVALCRAVLVVRGEAGSAVVGSTCPGSLDPAVPAGPGSLELEVSAFTSAMPPATNNPNASSTATAAMSMRARPLGSDR